MNDTERDERIERIDNNVREMGETVTRLNHQVWGVTGDNGLVSAVKGLRDDLKDDRDARADALKVNRRERITFLAAAVGPMAAFLLGRIG